MLKNTNVLIRVHVVSSRRRELYIRHNTAAHVVNNIWKFLRILCNGEIREIFLSNSLHHECKQRILAFSHRIGNDHVCSVEDRLPRISSTGTSGCLTNSRKCIILLNTSDHCLSDLEHDHIHEEIFLSVYFWEVFFIIFFRLVLISNAVYLIGMLYYREY